ncbi:MAG TPA: hypothetical protein EYN66_03795, partial [Myxococcales bacterium]|nr:hypothetical protein [Myxococcales bacterium]
MNVDFNINETNCELDALSSLDKKHDGYLNAQDANSKKKHGSSMIQVNDETRDITTLYLRRMGSVPLLTAEQEISISESIRNAERELLTMLLASKILRDEV